MDWLGLVSEGGRAEASRSVCRYSSRLPINPSRVGSRGWGVLAPSAFSALAARASAAAVTSKSTESVCKTLYQVYKTLFDTI